MGYYRDDVAGPFVEDGIVKYAKFMGAGARSSRHPLRQTLMHSRLALSFFSYEGQTTG